MTLIPIPVSAAAVKAAAEFFQRFGGISAFVETILGVPAGYLQHWHQDNLIRWYDKWQSEAELRKAAGKRPIPPSLLMPALQKIAMEDDDDVLAMWALLFANFQDPDNRVEPNKIYIHLLSEMQALDVMLLKHIVDVLPVTQRIVAGDYDTLVGVLHVTSDKLADDIQVSETNILLSLHNLNRLGCLLARPLDLNNYMLLESSPIQTPQVPSIITGDCTFFLSSLGSALIIACKSGSGRS